MFLDTWWSNTHVQILNFKFMFQISWTPGGQTHMFKFYNKYGMAFEYLD